MTEFSGYKAPRRPEMLFLTNDWYPHEIYENFREYEEDFRETVDSNVNVDERFLVVGETNGALDFDEFQEYAYSGEIDVAIADMELEGEDVEGSIRYEGHLPGEGAGRIKASFEVEGDPELKEDVDQYVSRHFNSFLGMDLGYNPLRSLR